MTIKSLPLFILISSGLLNASVVPGRWEKVDGLQEGTQIVVEMKSGDRLEGAFKGSSSQDLTVTNPAGSDRQVPKTAVAKIMTAEKVKDGLSNGMLIGMGVGTGVAVAGVALAVGGFDFGDECVACGLAILAGFAGGWAIGAAIDATHYGPEVLYQAP